MNLSCLCTAYICEVSEVGYLSFMGEYFVHMYTLQGLGNACALAGTLDGHYIVVGRTDGLVVIAADNQRIVASWVDNRVEITNIHLSSLDENSYLICTIDDLGKWKSSLHVKRSTV